MVRGQNKTSARRKVFVKTPNGTVTRYEEKGPGVPRCVSGRPLPGVARGRKKDVRKLSSSQRKPSRPYAGVLSAPVMRELFREQAHLMDSPEDVKAAPLYAVGRVCMKLAGRDAGKYCVIVDEQDGKFLIDGQTRRRAVSASHLEPINQLVKVKKGASSDEVVKALSSIEVEVSEPVKQRDFASKQ